MKLPKLHIADWGLILFSTGLLVYTALRAGMLSMTHDESSTFLNYIDQPLWECLYSPVCWGSANLHILNTFFMQIFVGIFGTDEIFIRLPNLIAHAVYLAYSILLLKRICPNHWIRIAGFLLLNANPYFLEYFSLGRGYGLAGACMMASVYSFFRYAEDRTARSLIAIYIWAVLAVLSNFTFLNYWAAVTGLLGLAILGKWPEGKNRALIWVILASVVLLGSVLFYPIQFLKELGEFGYGVATLQETYDFLLNDSIQHQGYFGKLTLPIFRVLGLALLIPMLATGILIGPSSHATRERFFFHISLMALIFFLALITQRYLLNTQYLVNRKAVIFIPLLGVVFVLGLQYWADRLTTGINAFAIILSLFICLHASRTYNLSYCREWYYDRYTRDMLDYLSNTISHDRQVKLGAYWLFSHSSNFYIQTQNLDYLTPIVYEKKLRTDRFYEYYYVATDQTELLHPDYVIEQQFGKVGILFRRKDVKR